MCGILGNFTTQPVTDFDLRLKTALRLLHHRGPDDYGVECFSISGGELALVHTRLSIIDLSSGGHQPMDSTDNRYSIVFNGEIYNYRELREELVSLGNKFNTESDTEVLLASWITWGLSSLPRLRGMFAFAVFDRYKNTLTCVRDAFGIKPLYYWRNGTKFIFSSELPALKVFLPKEPELNHTHAFNYLVNGVYDNNSETFYQDIHQLMPAHFIEITLGSIKDVRVRRWWWPSTVERNDLSFEQAADKLKDMFLHNIKLHLRSDVPIGVALSGGIDSSAVVCGIRHLHRSLPIHTFSYVARGSRFDEEPWVDLVNSYVGAIPHKVVVDTAELSEDLDDVIACQGEPFGSTSIYAQNRVFRLADANNVKVTLDGQGADELLAGYNVFLIPRLQSLWSLGQYKKILILIYNWIRKPGQGLGQAIILIMKNLFPIRISLFIRKLLGKPSVPAWINYQQPIYESVRFDQSKTALSIQSDRRMVESLRLRLTGNGLQSLLRHGDRNSMIWSIESRVPFLTIDIAEFLLSLPESYLLSDKGVTKSIFREAMRGIVPDQILDREDKIGLETPEQEWFSGQSNKIKDWMDGADLSLLLNSSECKKEVLSVLNGEKPFTAQTWRLVNYCRWLQLNID